MTDSSVTTVTSISDPAQLIADFRAKAERFGAVVAAGGDWAGASPCEGWTASDVLDHVIDTERQFLEQHGVNLGARPTGEPARRWQAHWAALAPALTEQLVTTEYDGYFGRTTFGATLRDFYSFDLVVHRWDLGTALGQQVELSEAELAWVESRIPEPGSRLYDAFYSEGVLGKPVPVPAGASRQTAVLAKLGRRG